MYSTPFCILTIFAKLKYYLDLNKLAITLQPSGNEELYHFSILIEKYRMKVFSCFSVPKFDLLLIYLIERSASATYNIWQANWVVLADFFFINVKKNCHFWSCSISYSCIGICDIYLEDRLLKFYFGFDIVKTIPVYIPTLLVISFI